MDIPDKGTGLHSGSRHTQLRNAVILPDGSKPVALGSGVITSLLGEGGMANVYEIWNPKLEVNRAVKLLHPNCSDDSKQRFQTEMKISAKLHHPNIIEIHGVGEWNTLPYIEMEKIDGLTLEEIINNRGALPLPVCTAVGITISRALTYSHNQEYVIYGITYNGVIHRDLKPSNIMVCKSGIVKLMDFGIARPTDASIHTTDGSILGTMQYLSPEQLDGVEPDVRTDIYSLGATMYEIITGVQAFPERNVSKLMMNKIKNDFRPLDDYKIKIPPRLKRILQKCMVQDREKRVPNAAILLSELEKIHHYITSDSPEQVMKTLINTESERIIVNSRRRLPLKTVGIVFAVVVLLVGFVAALRATYSSMIQRAQSAAQAQMPQIIETRTDEEVGGEEIKNEKASIASKPAPLRPKVMSESPKASPPPPVTPKPKTFVEMLTDQYGTSDLVSIFTSEVNKKNFQNAIRLYNKLPGDHSESKKVAIYYLRALAGAEDDGLKRFLDQNQIADGEFLLAKAVQAYKTQQYDNALTYLDKSLRSPRDFIDSEVFKRDVRYYKALCSTALFDESPTDENYKNALDAWWQLRLELRTMPDHVYNKKAEAERQRIGEKFRESKG